MSEAPQSTRPRTPWHLWVVGIVALLWNAMGAFDYLMTQTKNEAYMSHFTPEQLDYFYGFPAWVVSAWAIAVWGGVLGSLLLLVRRGLAYGVFLVSFLGLAITTIHNFVLTPGLEVIGGVGPMVFSATIVLVAILLILYSRVQKKRGVLV
jgi:hypothetical protein